MPQAQDGQGRLPEYAPVSIVDIGSNSVRMVVYDASRRTPTPVYNEKILCGLGRGVARTGIMDGDNISHALATLTRYRALTAQLGVEEVYAVATAAAREAKNGKSFVHDAERALGAKVKILTGKKEARLAAYGVLAGMPDADGLVADLGGGSLELIQVKDGKVRDGITLPLGPLRLMDLADGSTVKSRTLIADALHGLKVFDGLEGRDLYAVGGTWRNLARLQMAQIDYPLIVLHHYAIERSRARDFADLISRQSAESLADLPMISGNRAETLPLGAAVLEQVLGQVPVDRMVVSSYGVREGLLYSKLEAKRRRSDPLIAAARDLTRLRSRSLKYAEELFAWTGQLFRKGGIEETKTERRLRHAACLMGDIGWRSNPDYRGEQSLNIIANAELGGVTHADRAFLALAVYYRYEVGYRARFAHRLPELIEEHMMKRAWIISSAQRLAYVLSGALPGILEDFPLRLDGDVLTLKIPQKHRALLGERVQRRTEVLSAHLGLESRIKVAGKPR